MKPTNLMPTEQEMQAAITARDATYEGRFVFGLMTTGIFWRLSCSVRPAQPENLGFFADPDSAAETQPLPRAAKILSLSAARFQRVFKSVFGILPNTHQDQFHLGDSKAALKRGDLVTQAILIQGLVLLVGSTAMQAAISE